MEFPRPDEATPPKDFARIVVVGCSGAGKTTFAQALAQRLHLPHVQLDALYWGPDWTPRDDLHHNVQETVAAPRWVIDGNYSALRKLIWSRATTIIWLNYSFSIVFSRAVRRTLRRIISRELLFGGNRENLGSLISPSGIPCWVVRTFWTHRRDYPLAFQQPEFAHLQVLELRHPAEADELLLHVATIASPADSPHQ